MVAIDDGADVDIAASPERLLRFARSRVLARLDRALTFPITLLAAPAGFGKSTVLREGFARSGSGHRRLPPIAPGNGVPGLMRALATALGDVAPALLTSLVGTSNRVVNSPDSARLVARWAADHLDGVEAVIVVDDFGGDDDPRRAHHLAEIVDATAGKAIRWVIAVHRTDAFPVARWLADERMDLPIDDVDLALTFEDFLPAVDAPGACVDRETMRAICSSAAHWPAAVALALSSGRPAPATLPSDRPTGYDAFAACALDARREDERRFIFETCAFSWFDAQMLAVAGWPNAADLLGRLRDAGPFLAANADGSFRYVEAFRRYAVQRLAAESPSAAVRVAEAAAAVYRRLERWSEAVERYTELRACSPLVALVADHGFELIDRGETEVVMRALSVLCDADFAARPMALAVKASLESLHGSFDLAEAWFRHAIKSVEEPAARGAIVFRFATDLVRRDRRDAIDVLRPTVDAGGYDRALSVSLAGLLATAYATQHLDAEAAAAIAPALAQLDGVEDCAVRAKLLFQAGYVALFARDPVRARAFAERALAAATSAQLYDIAARALSILYNVAMDYEDDMLATRRYLDELASCSVKAGSRHLLMYATLGQYEVEVLAGNVVEATRLDQTLKTLEVDYSTVATETLVPAQALRAAWTSDFHRAYRLVAPTAEKQITPLRRAQRFAEIAVYAAAAGLRAEAVRSAVRAIATIPAGGDADNAIALTRAYAALALTLCGRGRRARAILAVTRDRYRPTARYRRILDAVRLVSERYRRGRYPAGFAAGLKRLEDCHFGGLGRLIEALPLPQAFRGRFSTLTDVERDVLVHLAAGTSVPEIALVSGIPDDIIASHVATLCRKLGCSSPRHAVALAASSNVLARTSR